MKSIAIIGAGGHAKVVAEIAELLGWEAISLFDEKWPEIERLEQWPIVGDIDRLIQSINDYDAYFVAIGDNKTRKNIIERISQFDIDLANLIHPQAVISQYASIGFGCVVMAGAVINPFSVLRTGVIINTSSTIDHDCVIESYTHISPGANLAGNVSCDQGCWVGIGSSVKQSVKIGSFSIIGAGSTVINDVESNDVVVGTPAKSIKK